MKRFVQIDSHEPFIWFCQTDSQMNQCLLKDLSRLIHRAFLSLHFCCVSVVVYFDSCLWTSCRSCRRLWTSARPSCSLLICAALSLCSLTVRRHVTCRHVWRTWITDGNIWAALWMSGGHLWRRLWCSVRWETPVVLYLYIIHMSLIRFIDIQDIYKPSNCLVPKSSNDKMLVFCNLRTSTRWVTVCSCGWRILTAEEMRSSLLITVRTSILYKSITKHFWYNFRTSCNRE